MANETVATYKDLPLISQGASKGVYHVWLPDGYEQAVYQLTAATGQVVAEGVLRGAASTLHLQATTKGIHLLTVRCGQHAQTLKIGL